jgi:hypothetical protein
MVTYIYCLIDPIDNQVKYIGKSNNINSRLNTHTTNSRLTKNTPKIQWIKSLKDKGLKPIIEEIDCVLITEWEFWEKHYISLYKSWNFKLKNSTNGGEGGDTNSGKTFRKRTLSEKINISEKTKLGMDNLEVKLKCSKGAYITLSKILDSNGKLQSDIVDKIREASKVEVHIIDELDNIIEKYNSIAEFKEVKNLNAYKFNKLKNRINNIHKINYTILKEF